MKCRKNSPCLSTYLMYVSIYARFQMYIVFMIKVKTYVQTYFVIKDRIRPALFGVGETYLASLLMYPLFLCLTLQMRT